MRTFSMILAAGLIALSAEAQNTQPRNTNTQNTPTTQNTQNTQGGNYRPLMMNDSTARALNLTKEQQQGWRERSALYDRDYRGLHPGTTYDTDRQRWWERRDADMKKFLTPEQYAQWHRMDTRPMGGTNDRMGQNQGGTNTTPPNK